MRNRKVARDPYWRRATFASSCRKCGRQIQLDDKEFFYPNTGARFCSADQCGKQASRDFDAARADEAFYNGGY